MITIFAYGSNMNFIRLKERTPSAKKIANALLSHYQFTCNKLSTRDGFAKGNVMQDIRGTGYGAFCTKYQKLKSQPSIARKEKARGTASIRSPYLIQV